MIIGFVGCIGAIKENKCLLLSVSIELLQCLLSCDAGAIAMHAAVTCISTEVAHLTQMRRESCVKQALIIALRSCRSFLTMEDETCREGIVSGGVGFLQRKKKGFVKTSFVEYL